MWSYLTRSFISPLPGYVENKAGDAENTLGRHDPVEFSGGIPLALVATVIIRCNTILPNSFPCSTPQARRRRWRKRLPRRDKVYSPRSETDYRAGPW
jgi:hypothetical protein